MAKVRLDADSTADQVVAPLMNADPAHGSIECDDGTGVVLTTPTSATIVGGSPAAAGESFKTTPAAAGTITLSRGGKYLCCFNASEITPVNSQVITLEVYKGSTAQGIKAKFTQPGTAVAIPAMCGVGVVSCARGDVLSVKAIADTGNFTVKRFQFTVVQLSEGQ